MTLKIINQAELRKERPVWGFKPGTNLKDHLREVAGVGADGKPAIVHEFIAAGDFAAAFYERQQYEVDAGRDLEPLVYNSFYNIIEDSTLPENIPVNRLGPAGVVFEKIVEGGEVKFVTVGESNFSVPIYHYANGIQYSEKLVMFNQLWSLSEVERAEGTALNALLNHIHINPILAYTYAAANQTNGHSLPDGFESTQTLPERYLRTLEQAMIDSKTDITNPRRGPFALMVATDNEFTAERALTVVPQQGITRQSSAQSRISTMLVYDGWTGSRGGETTTYGGVTAGKAYLIDLGYRDRHFRSYVKSPFRRQSGNPDVSRFILEQTVFDIWFGSYTDVAGGVQEITWPDMND